MNMVLLTTIYLVVECMLMFQLLFISLTDNVKAREGEDAKAQDDSGQDFNEEYDPNNYDYDDGDNNEDEFDFPAGKCAGWFE